MALFERSGLQQDTGLLSERWGQEGSVLRSGKGFDGQTLLTVTAGKTFYLKSVSFYITTGAPEQTSIRDSGNEKVGIAGSANQEASSIVFSAPIAFTTKVALPLA